MIKRLIGMLFISLACTSLVSAEAVKKEKVTEKALIKKQEKKQEKAKPIAAKKLFGFVLKGANLKAKAIGYYTRGCLSGGLPLAVNGEAWQAMRLSRNRNWGHPELIKFVEEFAKKVKEEDGWNGILVGDLSQPRGGPMLSGHRSHQMGLDADIWLNEMPDKRLSYKEREEISAVSMLDKTGLKVNPAVWTENHVKVIKRATEFKAVQRVLVHPAIKKALCKAAGDDRGWLRKVRPWWGHHYHMHIRLKCTEASCKAQNGTPAGDGCGKPLDYWFTLLKRPYKPRCIAGRHVLKNKKYVCTCPKNLKRVALGKKGGAKCVNEDGVIPKAKVVKKDLNWMPKACRVVLKTDNPPLFKARQLSNEIVLPVRKAVATTEVPDDKLGELIETTKTDDK